jgi:flagellar biosynthesis protein FliR
VNAVPVLLVLARLLGLVSTAPALAAPGLGLRYRLLLVGLLGALVAPVVLGRLDQALINTWTRIGPTLLAELVLGGALGATAGLVIAGARQAGEVAGSQAGLAAASFFDPQAGDELTPLGHLYGLVALGVFLALSGPLRLVHAIVDSYDAWPVGELSLEPASVAFLFSRVGNALELSIRAAAPVAIALSLAGLSIGLIARAAPSFSFAALSLPVRYLAGLFVAILGAVALAATITVAWQEWMSAVVQGG